MHFATLTCQRCPIGSSLKQISVQLAQLAVSKRIRHIKLLNFLNIYINILVVRKVCIVLTLTKEREWREE